MNALLNSRLACLPVLALLLVACSSGGNGGGPPVPPPPTGTQVAISALITDTANQALSGATVNEVGGSTTATTDANGNASLTLPAGRKHVFKISKTGFTDQFKTLDAPAGATQAGMSAQLLPRAPVLTVDAAAGGTLQGRDGASVVFAPNSLVNSAGQPVSGTVEVIMTPVNVAASAGGAFPGEFAGIDSANVERRIASFGTVEFLLSQNGARVNLAVGASATIEIPIYVTQHVNGSDIVVGQTIPLWSLNETTGLWKQEGQGTVVANPDSPTGLALRASVTHFTWWNCDDISDPEAALFVRCMLLDSAGQPTVAIPAGTTCTVIGAVPDLARRPRTGAFENVPPEGLNLRIPAGTNVELRGAITSPAGIGFTLVNVPANQTQNVVIAIAPPVPVAITSPGPDAVLTGVATAAVTVGGTVERVKLFLGGVEVGDDSTSPYTFTFDVSAHPEGYFPLDARAFSGTALRGLSLPVVVSIDRTAPVVRLTRRDATAADGMVKLRATVTDQSRSTVVFFRGNTELGSVTSPPFDFTYELTDADSPDVSFTALATDAANNATTSDVLTVETVPPSVTVSRSVDGTITSSQELTFTAQASDASDIARVEFFKGEVKLGEDLTAPFAQLYTVTGADEPSFVIRARAVDGAGNTAETSITVPVNISSGDAVPPTVALDALPDPIISATVDLAATASDNVGVAKVEFYRNGILLGETSAPDNGRFRLTAPVGSPGPVTFTARAYDAAGNQAESSRDSRVQLLLVDLGQGRGDGAPIHQAECAPSVAFDGQGTAYMTALGAFGANLQVFKLVNDSWQAIGGTVHDSNAQVPNPTCPSLVVTEAGVPFVAYFQVANSFTPSLHVRTPSGNTWVDVGNLFTADGFSGSPELLLDAQERLIIAYSGREAPGETQHFRLRRLETGVWTLLDDFGVGVNHLRLVQRPNGTLVLATAQDLGFGGEIRVREFNGTDFVELGDQVDVRTDGSVLLTVQDLAVDDTRTLVTYSRATAGESRTITKMSTGGNFALVGTDAEQLTSTSSTGVQASTILVDGAPLQVFARFNPASSATRQFANGVWTEPVPLPVDVAMPNLFEHDAQVYLACRGSDRAVLAEFNPPGATP